jgi:SAM-dependent methyltransferase
VSRPDSQAAVKPQPGVGESPRELFRRLDRRDYPEVDDYTWEEIYGHGDNMAPGGLYLAARMTRSVQLKPGDLVLDIACGKGDASLFLAEHFGASVVCFDLWTPSSVLGRKIDERGYRTQVIPLDLDAAKKLPFPEDYFDVMFCMQALHSFGTDVAVLRRLLKHLKTGGRLLVGGTCFNQEASEEGLPEIYSKTDGWDAEYSKYHSPSWWEALFLETGMVDVIECSELEDGLLMWEDEILHHGQRAGWTGEWYQKAKWLIDQLLYSRDHAPNLTHYVATLKRNKEIPEP